MKMAYAKPCKRVKMRAGEDEGILPACIDSVLRRCEPLVFTSEEGIHRGGSRLLVAGSGKCPVFTDVAAAVKIAEAQAY